MYQHSITNITYTTTGATGATFSGLPTGVTGNWAANIVTISGTPTTAGGTYTITLTGGCSVVNKTGTITVTANMTASVAIAASPSGAICSGTSVTFTATPTNPGTTPSYQWKLNGTNVGTNSATYANSGLVNGNTVTCVMTSNASPCVTGSPATSNTITATVNAIPTITGAVTPVTCSNGSDGAITITGLNVPIEFKKTDNDNIDLGSSFLSGRSAFTIEGWVKFNMADVGSRMSLFGQNDAIEFFLNPTTIQLYTAAGGGITTPLTAALGNNTWHHIAATGNGTNLRIYIDGGLVATGGSTTTNYGNSTAYNAQIGSGVVDPLTTAGGGFTGQIGKVGFYSTALSAGTISSLASNPTTYLGTETGLIAGYNFSEGSGTTLTSLPVGKNGTFGNSPQWAYTYAWTKIGTPAYSASTKNIIGLLPGDYNLSISGGQCPIAKTFTVGATNTSPSTPIVGTISQPCTVPTGSVVLSGLPAGNWTIYPGGIAGNTSSATISGLAAGTYNFTVSNGTCTSSPTSNVVINPAVTNTWNGTAWSNGTPNSSQKLVFSGNYPPAVDPDVDIVGCSCMVTGYTNVIIKSGKTLTITNEVTVVGSGPGAGTLTFENNASLVQINDVANSGDINYKRKYTGGQMDYTYWSSPVASQNLLLFSPTTKSDKFFSFVPATDYWLQVDPSTTAMIVGKGYIIRGIPPQPGPPPGLDTAIFKGVPNNGPQPITVLGGEKSNLIGNPYPSAIDADAFITANSAAIDGTLYFWTHNTPIAIGTPDPGTGVWAYSGNDYATYTLAGGVATKVGNITLDVEWVDTNYNRIVDASEFTDKNGNNTLDKGEWIDGNIINKLETGEWTDTNKNNIAEPGERTDTNGDGIFDTGEWKDLNGDYILNLEVEQVSNRPTGKIAAGQSFFTTSTAVGGEVKFTNTMRVDGSGNPLNNSKFYKTKNPKAKTSTTVEKNRVWLNLTNTQGAFKQTLVGYITGATNTWDKLYDGESFDGNDFLDFYSVNEEKNLTIQGRALPFDENDEIPLGYRIAVDGTFTINIDETDGLLTNQAVFIEDKLTNTVFDLKSGDYTFNTIAGTFNDRFVLRFTDKTLGTNDLAAQSNKVLISNKNKQIKINSFSETIDKVTIYDVLGRQIYQNGNVNSNEFLITNLVSSHQTLIVKTTLQNGKTVTNKIIY